MAMFRDEGHFVPVVASLLQKQAGSLGTLGYLSRPAS